MEKESFYVLLNPGCSAAVVREMLLEMGFLVRRPVTDNYLVIVAFGRDNYGRLYELLVRPGLTNFVRRAPRVRLPDPNMYF